MNDKTSRIDFEKRGQCAVAKTERCTFYAKWVDPSTDLMEASEGLDCLWKLPWNVELVCDNPQFGTKIYRRTKPATGDWEPLYEAMTA